MERVVSEKYKRRSELPLWMRRIALLREDILDLEQVEDWAYGASEIITPRMTDLADEIDYADSSITMDDDDANRIVDAIAYMLCGDGIEWIRRVTASSVETQEQIAAKSMASTERNIYLARLRILSRRNISSSIFSEQARARILKILEGMRE
jgi:hypothetical protein